MPNRKSPTLEEAKVLFLQEPNKTLVQFADEWGVTPERVRQLRHECGLGAVFSVDYEIVEKVAYLIENNISTLTSLKTYEDLPIGRDAFATWVRDDIDVAQKIHEAQQKAKANRLDPQEKKCSLCKEVKSVSSFSRTQKYQDGYNKFCTDCIDKLKNNKKDAPSKKTCLMCRKELSVGSFDSKSYFCKNCKSKSRRAKRARKLKTQ
jgi:hypothetical protein